MPNKVGRPQKTVGRDRKIKNLVTASPGKDDNGSMSTRKSPKKKSSVPYSKSHRVLDQLILDLKRNEEETYRIKQYEEQIMCLMTPKNKPRFDITVTKSSSSNISVEKKKKLVPGLQIIDPYKHQCFFSSVEDIKRLSNLHSENCTCRFEKYITKHPSLLSQLSTFKNYHGTFSHAFMLFMFRVMSIDGDMDVVRGCQQFLLHAIEAGHTDDNSWLPSLQDIVAVLLNYGCTVEEHCPLLQLFMATEKEMTALSRQNLDDTICNVPLTPHSKVLKLCNLAMLFGFLASLAKMGLYADDPLASFVLILCWLLLDPQTESIRNELLQCMLTYLSCITVIGWETKWAIQLSIQLSQLTDKPEDILKVCQYLPPVGRSQELRKAVSFSAAHRCLNAPYTFQASVRPGDVLNLLRSHPLTTLVDNIHLLEITLFHIDCAVGNDAEQLDTSALKRLSRTVHSTASRLVDSMLFLDTTLVKNNLIMLSCKWTVMAQQLVPWSNSSWKYTSWKNCLEDQQTLLENGTDIPQVSMDASELSMDASQVSTDASELSMDASQLGTDASYLPSDTKKYASSSTPARNSETFPKQNGVQLRGTPSEPLSSPEKSSIILVSSQGKPASKRRGRPRKTEIQAKRTCNMVTDEIRTSPVSHKEEPASKRRGRPRRTENQAKQTCNMITDVIRTSPVSHKEETVPKKQRGRPPKRKTRDQLNQTREASTGGRGNCLESRKAKNVTRGELNLHEVSLSCNSRMQTRRKNVTRGELNHHEDSLSHNGKLHTRRKLKFNM